MDSDDSIIIVNGGLMGDCGKSISPVSTFNETGSIDGSCGNLSERLLRKLSNFESTIDELMSLRRSTPILKEKLSQLDELILDIPNHCEEMANQWRVKVASWWRRYATYSATEEKGYPQPQQQQPSSSSDRFQMPATYNVFGSPTVHSLPQPVAPPRSFSAPPKPIGMPRIPDRRIWQQNTIPMVTSTSPISYANVASMRTTVAIPTPRFGASPNLPRFPDANCYNNFAGPITKNSIRTQLEAAFEELNDVREGSMIGTVAYIDGLQKLLAAVAKAIKAIIPYVSDDQLLLEVSAFAIQKMPTEKQIEFNGRYERKSLFNLMRFLRKEIVVYYEKFNAANQLFETAKSNLQASQQAQVPQQPIEMELPYCVYCRHDGHRVHECPIKRGMLCFKCYEFGHTLKCCPNSNLINIK